MKKEQEVRKGAQEVGKKGKEKAQEQFKTMYERVKEGATPKDLLGLNDALVEGLYGQAYRLYNTGKYEESSHLFRSLIMMNPTEAKYTMGLAACFHMQKKFKAAADTYSICGVLEPNNPIPYFHASDCYLQIGDKLSAIVALETAMKQAGEQPQFAKLKDRAQLSLEGIKKDYKEWSQQYAPSEKKGNKGKPKTKE